MSTAATLNPLPHRKPVPGRASYSNLQQVQPPPVQYGAGEQNTYPRTMTSTTGPAPVQPNSMYSNPPQQRPANSQRDRRTLSNATASTVSTNPALQRAPTNSSASGPRRSTSSRSNTSTASPTSYVALMRKQKATVWCDRAQLEDPRILAAQRAQKMRAAMEVAGSTHRFSTSSNTAPQSQGIRSKIRHHGLPKANTYTGQANLAGAGVPLRLSATEVDENDSDEEADSRQAKYHSRTGSRGSSMGSGRHPNPNYLTSGRGYSGSAGSTPISGHSPTGGDSGTNSEEQTPMAADYQGQSGGYFAGGEDEEERSFGRVGGLPQRVSVRSPEEEKKINDDLRRRGSVDDRTMTMSAGRLFVANPDLSD